MVYPLLIALIGPKKYFVRRKIERLISLTNGYRKKPILENAIEYIWVNNAQLDLVNYL